MKVKNLAGAIALASSVVPFSGAIAETKIEEVKVISSRSDFTLRQMGTSVTVLDQVDIEALGYNDVPSLLRTVTGIGVSNSGGAGKQTSIRVRGEEGYRTQVRIDGMKLTDTSATQAQPQVQHLMSGGISRIEVLRGPQGLIYGADAGGVINLYTPIVNDGFKANISAEAGGDSTRIFNGNFAGGNNIADFSLMLSDFSADGFNSRASDTSGDLDGYDNTTAHMKVGVSPVEDLRLQLIARDVSGETEFDRCFGSNGGTNDCSAEYDEEALSIGASYNNDVVNASLSYAQTSIERNRFADGNFSGGSEGDLDRVEAYANISLTDFLSILVGSDWENEEILSGGDKIDREQLAGYAELQLNISDQFYFTGGARYDDNEVFGSFNSYRVTSAYLLGLGDGNELKFKASYATGFRAPSLFEQAYNNSASAFGQAAGLVLEDESSEGTDIGIEYFGAGGLFVEVVYFDQTIENEVFFDLVGFSGYLQSEGETESKGMELTYDIPVSQSFSINGNYTYNDTESETGAQRVRRPRHIANLGTSLKLIGNQLSFNANLRVVRDATNEIFGLGIVELDDYETLDVSVRYEPVDMVALYASLENVFDEEYEEITDFNITGRFLSAGVKFSF